MIEELTAALLQYPYAGLFAMLILGVILPLPEEATLILCGILIARQTIEPAPALTCVYAGLLVSDFLIYFAGRKFGRRCLAHPRMHRFLPPDIRMKIEDRFRRYGLLLIIFGRHIIGFRTKLFVVAGLTGISPQRFLLTDALAAFISMSIMVTAGYTGSDLLLLLHQALASISPVVIQLAAFLALFILTCVLIPKLIRRFKENC